MTIIEQKLAAERARAIAAYRRNPRVDFEATTHGGIKYVVAPDGVYLQVMSADDGVMQERRIYS